MNKKILIAMLALTMLTASKCNDGMPRDLDFISEACEGPVTSITISYFAYGDGKMVIIPISDVQEGAPFIIGLDPRKRFKDAEVTVKGTSDGADWIDGSGKFEDLPKDPIRGKVAILEAGCAPTDPEHEYYKYEIKVVKEFDDEPGRDPVINILDPRARVVQ